MSDNKTIVKSEEIYLHVNNGGISFSIIDEGFGPTILIQQSHMGGVQTEQKVHTTTESLQKIGDMFIKASQEDFSKEYCCAAKLLVPRAPGPHPLPDIELKSLHDDIAIGLNQLENGEKTDYDDQSLDILASDIKQNGRLKRNHDFQSKEGNL